MRALSRRAILAATPLALWANRKDGYQAFPADWRRFADSATEFEVTRLTDPNSYSAILATRAISRKNDAIFYASDRQGGAWQAYRLDLKSGTSGRMTEATHLEPESVTFLSDDRGVAYVDGDLIATDFGSRPQELARLNPGNRRQAGPIASEDGQNLFWAEGAAAGGLLRRLRMPKGSPETVTETKAPIAECVPNPRRATVLWRLEDGTLWVATFEGQGVRQVATPEGRVAQAIWSPDGRSLLYLHIPQDRTRLNAIREQDLDSRADRLVAPTSQFARFTCNSNASVFLGASQSKASPNVLLLLRLTKREFTLCEHRAAKPDATDPQFSPNSQRIFFQSDRDGKPAIYMMVVDRLVEKTET